MKLKSRVGVIAVSAAMSVMIFAVEFASSQANPDPRLIEGARKEGEVIFYTTMTLDQSKEVVDRFQKKYPFIKPTLFRTGGGPLLNKILNEARAGRHAWDVAAGRAEMYVPLMERKLLASYRSPEEGDRRRSGRQGRLLDGLLCRHLRLGMAYQVGQARRCAEDLRGLGRAKMERPTVLR